MKSPRGGTSAGPTPSWERRRESDPHRASDTRTGSGDSTHSWSARMVDPDAKHSNRGSPAIRRGASRDLGAARLPGHRLESPATPRAWPLRPGDRRPARRHRQDCRQGDSLASSDRSPLKADQRQALTCPLALPAWQRTLDASLAGVGLHFSAPVGLALAARSRAPSDSNRRVWEIE